MQALSGKLPHYQSKKLSPISRLRETVILRLRLLKGLNIERLIDESGLFQETAELRQQLESLHAAGLLRRSGAHIALSRKGVRLYNIVASTLI